jgi:CHASE3 domain sensor protein
MPISNASFIRSTQALLGGGTSHFDPVAGSSVWLAERTRENAADVQDPQSIRSRTSRLLILLLDAESGQRGFLLTQDPRYLEPVRGRAQDYRRNGIQLKRRCRSTAARGTCISLPFAR